MLASLLLGALLFTPTADAKKKKAAEPDITDVAAQLLGRSLTTDGAWDKLVELCDDIGHRLSGSPQLEQAVTWSHDTMAAEGLDASLEPVMVPTWVRGKEHAVLHGPYEQELNILTLGNSVGTDGPIRAEVMVVGSWDELAERSDEAKGKIVLFDVPFTTYGATVDYRGRGAIEASKLGAVAALMRSVGPHSLDTPHTGALRYEDGVEKIPGVAVTIEAAATMRRLVERDKTIEVTLDLGAHFLEDKPSHNVIGEVKGREKPDEAIVVSCHLDSWDVGQGAQDDGAGCTAAMEVGRLIAALPTPPRRTVRVVLYTNEENGLRGGRTYAEDHAGETIVAAMEMDTGSGMPEGWRVDVRREDSEEQARLKQQAMAFLAPVSDMLAPIGAGALIDGYSGADIGPLVEQGVLGLGVQMDMTGYWPIHHTRADTIEKIDPQALRKNVAVMAVTAWWLAESPDLPLE